MPLCVFLQLLVENLAIAQKIEDFTKKSKIMGHGSLPSASSTASIDSSQPSEGHGDAQDNSEWEMLSDVVSSSGEERTAKETAKESEVEVVSHDANIGGDVEALRADLLHKEDSVVGAQCLSLLILYVGMGFMVLHLWNLVTHVM